MSKFAATGIQSFSITVQKLILSIRRLSCLCSPRQRTSMCPHVVRSEHAHVSFVLPHSPLCVRSFTAHTSAYRGVLSGFRILTLIQRQLLQTDHMITSHTTFKLGFSMCEVVGWRPPSSNSFRPSSNNPGARHHHLAHTEAHHTCPPFGFLLARL